MLYDPYSGETSNSLQDVMNGFRVITASSIAEDSVVIILKVRTTVGGGISTRMITNEKDELERREINKAEDKEPYNTESLIIGEEELEGFGRVLVKKDGCDEDIVYAIINEPQKLSLEKSEIKKLNASSWWSWIDNNNIPRSAQIGDPASYGATGSGATLFLKEIVYNINIKWKFGNDFTINTLLDTILKSPDDYRWIFNVTNLRIPILSDLSLWNLEGAINLGDGTDTLLLSTHITNNDIYNMTLYKLDLFIDGPYSNQFEILEGPNFVFYPGILFHEEYHFIMKKRFISQRLDNHTFPIIRRLSLNRVDYPCPEQTTIQHQHIIRHLESGILVGGTLSFAKDDEINLRGSKSVRMKKGSEYVVINVPVSELEADKYASGFYVSVKNRIREWWKTR